MTSPVSVFAQSDQQQGSVLVIVLMLVVLLSTASVIALKNSQTSLEVITAAQVNRLLFQASDVPLAHLKTMVDQPDNLAQLMSPQGPMGYLIKQPFIKANQHSWAEYVVCYQPTRYKSWLEGSARHKRVGVQGGIINPQGYCNIANRQMNHYTSDRQLIATQLSFTRPIMAVSESADNTISGAVDGMAIVLDALGSPKPAHHTNPVVQNHGSVTDNTVPQQTLIRVYVTSVMPVFSSAKLKQIDDCLAKSMVVITADDSSHSSQQQESQMACLSRTKTPHDVQVQDYLYIYQTPVNNE